MDKLKELRYKKTRQQLRYVQLELEETKLVYENCVDKFNIEFKDELLDSKEEQEDVENSFFKIRTTVDEKTIKDIYKRIAIKVHPDKQTGDEEKFKILNRANKNKDYGLMMDMADELNIKIRNDEENYNNYKKQIRAIIETIKDMQMTFAWQWEHIEDNQKSAYRDHILKQMEL